MPATFDERHTTYVCWYASCDLTAARHTGWYWYHVDQRGDLYGDLFGPFPSRASALFDAAEAAFAELTTRCEQGR